MSYCLERVIQVERDLMVEQGFAPLEQALPLSGQAGAQFHACVARQRQDRIDVHALLSWTGQSGQDLAARADILRKALEAATAFFNGRVAVALFLAGDGEAEQELAWQALKAVRAGHFLEKIQINALGVNVRNGQLRFEGRVKPEPGLAWFEEHFLSGGRHDSEAVARALELREKDEVQSRHFLSQSSPAPWATYSLIGLNGFMFVATLAMAGDLVNQGSLTLGQRQYWRLISSLFIHADIIHLLMNMVALYSLGGLLERFAGPVRMLILYFFAGSLGSLLSAWQNPGIGSLGASGAILGLAGAILALRFRRPEGFPRLLAQRLYASLLWPVLFIFVVGLGLSFLNGRVMLDNWGHLGGLSAGFGLVMAWPALLGRNPQGALD
jgi:rhomboid protease GluP